MVGCRWFTVFRDSDNTRQRYGRNIYDCKFQIANLLVSCGKSTVWYRCGQRTNIRITYKSHINHIRNPAADTGIFLRTPPSPPHYRIRIRIVGQRASPVLFPMR